MGRGSTSLGQAAVHIPGGWNSATLRRTSSFPTWLLLVASCAPTIDIFLAGFKFTIARAAILCLLVPALSVLLAGNRRVVASDVFGFAFAVWMILATAITEAGINSSALAEALEFFGAYLIARAYTYGPIGLSIFVRALKSVILVLVILAIFDTISGRNITLQAVASVLPGVGASNAYRLNLVRASATFDGSTQFGTFCAVAAAVLFGTTRRLIYGGLCVLGCLLSITSAAFMGLFVVVSVYAYNIIFERFAGRWRLLWLIFAGLVLVASLISNDPIAWIISHLTFDPSDGWFRLNTWYHQTHNISLSPWLGYGFEKYGDPEDYFDQASVDCVWLVMGLVYGLPAVGLLILTNVGAFSNFGRKRGSDRYLDRMATGFTLSLAVFMFIGLTVHYWHHPWILWGLFIGVRASLKEYNLLSLKATAAVDRPRLHAARQPPRDAIKPVWDARR